MSAPVQLTEQEKSRKPWKYEGYPGFSRWMASSTDCFILRRFGQLNVRTILLMQDRIARKEQALLKLDEDARQGPDNIGDSSSLRHEPIKEREEILDELIPILKEYSEFRGLNDPSVAEIKDEYVLAYSQIQTWQSAKKYQIENLEAWFWNHPSAIDQQEQEFVRKGGDVVALVQKVKSPLRLFLENFQSLLTIKVFRTRKRAHHVESATTIYYSNTGFDAFVNGLLIVLGLVLLLAPMWTLQFVSNNVKRLAIISGFILLFISLLASSTRARPFEVLASTAAYSAVLMVFLQLGRTN